MICFVCFLGSLISNDIHCFVKNKQCFSWGSYRAQDYAYVFWFSVLVGFYSVMKNPANLAKHQSNPKVAPIIAKMMGKFAGSQWVVIAGSHFGITGGFYCFEGRLHVFGTCFKNSVLDRKCFFTIWVHIWYDAIYLRIWQLVKIMDLLRMYLISNHLGMLICFMLHKLED